MYLFVFELEFGSCLKIKTFRGIFTFTKLQ